MKTPDYIVFFIYFIIVSTYGWYVYKKKKHEDSKDYFLAKDSLTWWAIGASLIASNISAEQFIGMSGSGFTMGLAIAAYEWLAAITLLIVAVFSYLSISRIRSIPCLSFLKRGIMIRWL